MSTDPGESGVSRRSFLRYGTAAAGTAASVGSSGCLYVIGLRQRENRHREVAKYRRKHGGAPVSFASQRKRIRKKDATIVVHNRSELLEAIKKPGAVIWIPADVTIDLTGELNLAIAPNVTIASNRNLSKANGALIKYEDYGHLFMVPQQGARLTGVRLRGPYTKYRGFATKPETYAHAAYGIWFRGQSGIVDNCEMWGWPGYAIGAGTKGTATQVWIHHNDIHHTQLGGLGYALESLNGMSLVEWNNFSHFRHVVSGYGYKTNGYEFRCNVVGPPQNPDPANFACDMHSLGEQDNYPAHIKQAGKYINVHHNVFEYSSENAMSISGIPTKYARFCNNWTAHNQEGFGPSAPAVYVPDGATLKMHENHFGVDTLDAGREQLKQMNKQLPVSNGKPSPSSWSPSQNRKKNNKNNNKNNKKNGNSDKNKKKNATESRTTTSKKQQRRIVRSSSYAPAERSLLEVN